jgi:diguanylate cyclase (GGDEF)-like protein
MKVLIVDDSKAIRKYIAECIAALGHQPFYAENGIEAVEFVKSNAVDLIMMDVEMPDMNGFEATKKIRELLKENWVPIIIITQKIDESAYTEGILAGADAYIHKPIKPLHLQLQIMAMQRIYDTREKLKATQQQLLEANEKLLKISMIDELTGLANRRSFNRHLEEQFGLARREKNPLSVIICDIDFFKIYNDNHGHAEGDDCLRRVAEAIASVPSRPTDMACRYGGEEFTLILPNTDLQGGLFVAEKVRQAVLMADIPHEGSKIASQVTLSLGLATYTGQFKTGEDITKAADEALYRAKGQGRNRFEAAA